MTRMHVVCSDAYTVTPESTVVLTAPQQPFIKLDDKHYKLVDKMEALVEGYPSLLECTSLKVRPWLRCSPLSNMDIIHPRLCACMQLAPTLPEWLFGSQSCMSSYSTSSCVLSSRFPTLSA